MPTALVALFLAVTTSSAAGVIRRPGLSDGRTASAISSTALSAMPVTRLPAGVSLHPIDGGAHYFAKWHNGFPGSTRFIPIGVYPSEGSPSALAAMGINFFTPARDENAGTWCPAWHNPHGNDMTHVNATPGFYAGGTFYHTRNGRRWGGRAAFNVFGDELDGNAGNWFDCLPSNISANSRAGSWGGLSAKSFLAAEAASHADDPSRPTYIQTTVTFMDGGKNYFYTTAQKLAICARAGIFSFDIYPLVLRGGHVWDMYDQVKEARGYCRNSRPVMAFTEMDRMDGGSIYPMPAQTEAEVWNAVVAGARGIEYFDQYGTIDDRSYTGNGHYSAGAMRKAISTTNARIHALAPVLNGRTANGYVTATGSVRILAKYHSGHFYIFVVPHTARRQTVTFSLAGIPTTTARVLYEGRTLRIINGRFSDTFTSASTIHIYEVNKKY